MSEKEKSGAISIAPSLNGHQDYETGPVAPAVSGRVLLLSLQVVVNAVIIGLIAKVLVALINLITQLSFYGRFSFEEVGPAGHQLGWLVIFVPVIGGILVGIMARTGSAAIRGHGIPEAMEQVLVNESRIKPIITFLKPLSAAISIGTGGPFGAEGPIIATGGAFGSLAGQIMRITPHERKIMLTAGATAGMAAIFGTPLAAVLLAIELLLFEFSPRSIIPVALGCVTGAAMHYLLFSSAPVFVMPEIAAADTAAMITYTVMGAVIGVCAAVVTRSVYFIEDLFEKLPIHWMWWPAIGALAVGITGYFAPYTMGVGYNNITELLTGQVTVSLVLGLCFLKFISWSVSLGSGTSGGTLAPLLTIGGATGLGLGMLILQVYPGSHISLPICALIGMAAMFAGAARALLTSIVFALETTMQPHGLLPLLAACTASYFVSFFLMKHSIMTEKIQRRGVATPDAYEPDLLMGLHVKTLMESLVPAVRVNEMLTKLPDAPGMIILAEDGQFNGVVNMREVYTQMQHGAVSGMQLTGKRISVLSTHSLISAITIMEETGLDLLPVVSESDTNEVTGIITKNGILSWYYQQKKKQGRFSRAISIRRRSYAMIVKTKQRTRRD